MTTFVLTPNTPNPLTGFVNPILGWQLTLPTAIDVLEGCNLIFEAGWIATLGPLATSTTNPPIWQLLINNKALGFQVIVNDTDYFVFDGQNVSTIPLVTVSADYTVTTQAAPTPPTTTT
jgi:hypothetical protein